ncbi:glycoside hydrolase family 3 C-terminal domain-containing protein [Actinomadura madurae]|uniref:glycoside hydrolase family 3 protein n=1 Tax=Actinomadura madurae TaxID=1993 RepID=UPI00399AA8C4
MDDSRLRARLADLSLEEKVHLLTGDGFWTLRPLPKIGLRRIVMSDGPSGVRGTAWDERAPSLLFPNPSALAATWDPALAERVGRLNGAQARDKGVHVQLAPTVNLHRTPLGGRHFENYSEDPLLTARIGAAFVRGVQSAGVAATVKHFVGNDSETARRSYDARIGDDALDELYLRPFEEAVRAGAWAVMAAYNGVNGASMTENRPLLTGVLKERWGFDGVVVSDWTAIRSTAPSANAGMDLEMPGLPRSPWRARLVAAVRDGEVAEALIDDKVLRVLRLAARVGALDGFPEPPPVTTPPDARDRLREVAVRAAVLLRNEDGALPLNSPRRIAVLGPNAVRFSAQGGGSAHVEPARVVTPVEGLRRALGDGTELVVRAGVHSHTRLAPLPLGLTADPETGEPGVRLDFLDGDDVLLVSEHRMATRFVLLGGVPEGTARIVLRARVTPAADGVQTFAVTGTGEYELRVGEATTAVTLSLDGGDPVEGMLRPPEHRVEADLPAGVPVPVELRHSRAPSRFGASFGLGYHEPHPSEDEELAAAVAAARDADAAVVVVGTNDEVESEGFDRTSLALPGRQDELVSAVAAANPRTIVVVNAGAPVLMPWRDEVAAVLWAWLPGQEGGDAIADVLTGAAEPGGRLPTTLPASEDGVLSPIPSEDGTLDYAEGTVIGYRHYTPAQVAYPFGHGLGYTTWDYESLAFSGDVAEVTVRNTGSRAGREVVQLYALYGGAVRLAGFAVAEAAAGASVTVAITPDERLPAPRAFRAGRSAADLQTSTTWTDLG